MTDETTVNEADSGKRVVDSSGETIGVVVEVEKNALHVNPDPDITSSIMSKLGWEDKTEEETYRIDPSRVDTITDDEIRLEM